MTTVDAHPDVSAIEMPVTSSIEKLTTTESGCSLTPVTSPSVMASTSTASEVEQHPDSYFDEPTSPANTVEEEGEVSDQETDAPTQDSDQQLSGEKSYSQTLRGSGLLWDRLGSQSLKVLLHPRTTTLLLVPEAIPLGRSL